MTRSVLITGCSSGIGLDFAQTLHRRGWQVLATCRKQADCDRLTAEGLTSFILDHDEDASITNAIQTTLKLTEGRLDAVVLNGAFAQPGAMEDIPRDAMRAVYETNLFGPFEIIRQVIPVMREQGHGRIVNISSVLGILPLRMRGPYCGTKFAMEGMTQALRLELAGSGIHVSVIQPGPITSRIRQNAAAHFERWIDWERSTKKASCRASTPTRNAPTVSNCHRPPAPKSSFTPSNTPIHAQNIV